MNLVDAIARMEGYGVTNTLATNNNNPGNIVFGSFAKGYGAVKDSKSGFAVFPDSSTGYQAANDLLAGKGYNNLSLSDAISKWNGHGANSASYAQNVANWLGVNVSDRVGSILTGSGSSSSSNNEQSSSDNYSWYDNSVYDNDGYDSSGLIEEHPILIASGLLVGIWVLIDLLRK